MDEATFRRETMRARTRASVEPQHADYWRGYQDGLRRARLGTRFVSDAEHRYWLTLVHSREASCAARGAGYRDGIAAAARTGRRAAH